MSLKKSLARLLFLGVLQCGALAGVTTPEEIEKLMNLMHRTKIEHVVKQDDPDRDKGVPGSDPQQLPVP
jgi:hypothetical protein